MQPAENQSNEPLQNPFDVKHFITHIIEKYPAEQFQDKELDYLSVWLDPSVPTEEKQKLIHSLPKDTLQGLLLRLIPLSEEKIFKHALLRSLWENNLDMSNFKDRIVAYCCSSDESLAMEACTVLRENVIFTDENEKKEWLLRYTENQFAQPYIYELFKYALEEK